MTTEQLVPVETTDPVKRRRRGSELEDALLTAAWDELADVGFAKLTMESVADRAKTGIAVLYRRWSNKSDLVLAAIRHYSETHRLAVPDTGDLRDDLFILLTNFNAGRTEVVALLGATFAGLQDSAGLTIEDVRNIVRGDGPRLSDDVYRRAHERGEIDLTQVPRDILDLPFQLVRHDVLMTLQPVPPERIRTIVDDIFWPLATATRAADQPPPTI
jgi:AcrR family transcriptional regulator